MANLIKMDWTHSGREHNCKSNEMTWKGKHNKKHDSIESWFAKVKGRTTGVQRKRPTYWEQTIRVGHHQVNANHSHVSSEYADELDSKAASTEKTNLKNPCERSTRCFKVKVVYKTLLHWLPLKKLPNSVWVRINYLGFFQKKKNKHSKLVTGKRCLH